MSLDVLQRPQQQPAEGGVAAAPVGGDPAGRAAELVDHVAFLSIVALWSVYVMPARGGWQTGVVPVACLAAFVALLALRPWRHCPAWLSLVAAAPAVGALVVAAYAPYGDGGPVSVSRWGYFGILLLAAAAYARTSSRRAATLCAVLLAGLHQYVQAWVPWWGGDDGVVRVMTGTLYSANPFGGLMLALALLAGVTAVLGTGRLRQLAWLVAPVCVSGVFLSAARAAVVLLLVGSLLLAVVALRVGGARGVVRLSVLALLSWAFLALTTSSLVFEGGRGVMSGVQSKQDSGQTLDSTTGARMDHWKAAWGEFADQPLLGGGVGSYAVDSRARMVPGAQRSPFAHNEVLGSLAEGGLVLGLPVLLALLTALALFTRALVRALRRASGGLDVPGVAAGLAGGALLAHAMVDFPLSFPALLGLLALLAGCCAAPTRTPLIRTPRVLALAPAATALLLCGAYAGLSHDQAGVGARADTRAVAADGRVLLEPFPGLRDARLQVAQATRMARQPEADPSDLEAARRAIEPLLPFDLALARTQVDLLLAEGRDAEATSLARRLALTARGKAPILVSPYAERLLAQGQRRQAFDVLAYEVHSRAGEPGRLPSQLVAVLDRASGLAGPVEPGWSCARAALLAAGALDEEHGLTQIPAQGASPRACTAWSDEASDILGDRR